jgi:glutamyl-tRNA reductase
VVFDLAVPRDVDPNIAKIEGVRLYDVDAMGSGQRREDEDPSVIVALNVINEEMEDFYSWYFFRDYVPTINEISDIAARDAQARLKGRLKGSLDTDVSDMMYDAVFKTVGRLMFGLKESMSRDMWDYCISGLRKSAEIPKEAIR